MGQDKAFLPVEWEGGSIPLWERQLLVLRSIAPEQVVISGPRKKGYPSSATVFADEWAGAGPLGGIATCLNRSRSALLLVLAIDLPKIQPGFLRKLLARSETGCGIVPMYANRFEPLIAIYPTAALEIAIDQLRMQDYVLQHFIARLLERSLLNCYEVESGEQDGLENWNTPGDVG